jgi:hypothetical protein
MFQYSVTAMGLTTEESEFDSRHDERNFNLFHSVQTGSDADPASCPIRDMFQKIMRPEREADRSYRPGIGGAMCLLIHTLFNGMLLN